MKTTGYLLIIAVLVLLVGIVAATGGGLWLLMFAYVIPPLLFLYVIGQVLVAVVRWLER